MKKIPVWKVILLSIVTFGIYTLVWLALRRNELVKNYGQKLPHWLWLIIPIAVAIGLFLPLIVAAVWFIADPNQALLFLTVGSMLLFFVPFAISLWWISRFGIVMSKLTRERVPTLWTILLYFFCGPIIIAIYQYYFNRYPVEKMPAEKPVGPSKTFMAVSIVVIVLSLISGVLSLMSFPAEYTKAQEEMKRTSQEAVPKNAELLQEAEKLLTDYQACTDKLESDYPGELYEEDEASYNAAYDKCEEIRIKQWEAADRYNKL